MNSLLFCLSLHIAASAAVKNPIISGWNPDPAILRVGDEYIIATSSFEYFPGTPIYKSKDLANWELYSHAATSPNQLQLYGVPTGAGTWAPSLSYINGLYYLASMTRWVYDPVQRLWPKVFFKTSSDLVTWSEPVWCDPWGIDPELFQDPVSNRTYLNLMAPNNNVDRIWGIYQCEISLQTGKCIGEYRSLWNGTLEHNSTARDEGPKMFFRNNYYYLLIAEGGTDDLHRSTIARSHSPEGPWTPAPNNPILFNGKYGFDNLTVQSTGHATFVDSPRGDWYASFLARRKINGSSPLGRETFLTTVTWEDDWPILNGGNPILLSESIPGTPEVKTPPANWVESFDGKELDLTWYQLRTPYTQNYRLGSSTQKRTGSSAGNRGLTFIPNVFGLSDRDTPAAILRKQKSLNMTFSATLLGAEGSLGLRQSVGISVYLSEFQHEDIGLRGCANTTGMCIYSELNMNGTIFNQEIPLNHSTIPDDLTLHIRAEPLTYSLGYSFDSNAPIWIAEAASSWLAFAPTGFFVFSGASFGLFASGAGEPWPVDGPDVGFREVNEVYYEENIPDYDKWD